MSILTSVINESTEIRVWNQNYDEIVCKIVCEIVREIVNEAVSEIVRFNIYLAYACSIFQTDNQFTDFTVWQHRVLKLTEF